MPADCLERVIVRSFLVASALAAATAATACSKETPVATNDRGAAPAAAPAAATADTGDGVAGLPFAHGRRFRTLDEYLQHLERNAAPIDQPWWREIRPGVYEHVKRLPGAPRETATREELMKRFGFTR